jgi:hypothetical protein
MPTDIEHWIATVHAALPDAEFLSLEPEDGTHALLAAVWLQEGHTYRILAFGNQSYGKPEFVLDMDADDQDQAYEWALALLQFLDDNRQSADMVPGALFAADQPLVDFAAMQGWLVGLACTLETLGLQTPHVRIYPIYKAEVDTCKAVGLSLFLKKAGQDIRNPRRLPLLPPPLN